MVGKEGEQKDWAYEAAVEGGLKMRYEIESEKNYCNLRFTYL